MHFFRVLSTNGKHAITQLSLDLVDLVEFLSRTFYYIHRGGRGGAVLRHTSSPHPPPLWLLFYFFYPIARNKSTKSTKLAYNPVFALFYLVDFCKNFSTSYPPKQLFFHQQRKKQLPRTDVEGASSVCEYRGQP